LTCEACFAEILTAGQIADLEVAFQFGGPGPGQGILIDLGTAQTAVNSFEAFCDLLLSPLFDPTIPQLNNVVNQLVAPIEPDPSPETIVDLVACLAEALGIE
jgi:hypothetical protein